MDSARWELAQEIFQRALELAHHQRDEYLIVACKGDLDLLNEVERMLLADGEGNGMLVPPLEYAAERLQPGSRLGNFQLEEFLGEGGMGRVFVAREIGLDRRVALKTMLPRLATRESDLERFHREARAVAKLEHPGIVPILTIGEDHGIHFFTMRLIEGPNLHQVLVARRNFTDLDAGWIPPFDSDEYIPRVAEGISAVADALEFAHSNGVVHRDVKPSNLMVQPGGGFGLVDFGIMRDEALGTLTLTGEIQGSLHYMSPEQARISKARVDHRTDVYSLGVVLYELLTMVRPFEGQTTSEVLNRLESRKPKAVRDLNPKVPRDLEVICTRAMARESVDRYGTAGELAGDLRRFLGSKPIQATPIPLGRVIQLWVKRNPLLVAAVAASLVACALGAFWMRASVRNERVEQLVANVRPFQEIADFHSPSMTEVFQLSRALSELTEVESSLSQEDRQLVGNARQLLDRVAREGKGERLGVGEEQGLLGDGEADIQRARDAFRRQWQNVIQGRGDESLDDVLLDEWGIRVSVAAFSRSGDPLERVSVRVSRFPGVSSVPEVTATAEPLGLEERVVVLGGFYRIEVRDGAGDLLEFDRVLSKDAGDCHIVADFRRHREPGEDMVEIRPVPVTYPTEPGGLTPLHGVLLDLEPFWLQRYEVSNAEYLEFVREQPHRRSNLWNAASYRSEWGTLPVTGITVEDASAYAEWRGMRLPTDAELEYAGRGPNGRRYPWTDEQRPTELLGNVHLPSRPEGIDAVDSFSIYLRSVDPVRSSPESASEYGVHHLLGNVAEITGTPAWRKDDAGGWISMPGCSVVLGSFWVVRERSQDLAQTHSFQLHGRGNASYFRGFRCARSVR